MTKLAQLKPESFQPYLGQFLTLDDDQSIILKVSSYTYSFQHSCSALEYVATQLSTTNPNTKMWVFEMFRWPVIMRHSTFERPGFVLETEPFGRYREDTTGGDPWLLSLIISSTLLTAWVQAPSSGEWCLLSTTDVLLSCDADQLTPPVTCKIVQ